MRKIKDIFSYVKAETLSLEEISRLFNYSIIGVDISPYKIVFSFDEESLNMSQNNAYHRVLDLGDEAAVLLYDEQPLAIIGYVIC